MMCDGGFYTVYNHSFPSDVDGGIYILSTSVKMNLPYLSQDSEKDLRTTCVTASEEDIQSFGFLK